MIDLRNQTISVPGFKTETIQKWEVWFVTAQGLTKDIPDGLFMPIPVAVGDTVYECFMVQGFEDGKETLSSEGSPIQSG